MAIRPRGRKLMIDVTVGEERYRRSAGTDNEAVAARLATQVRRALLRGERPCVGRLTFGPAVDEAWEKYYKHTRGHYVVRYALTELRRRVGESTELASIDEAAIDTLVAELRAAGDSNATINRKLSVLRRVLRLNKLKLPRMPDFPTLVEGAGRVRIITAEEEQRILEWFAAEGDEEMADLTCVLLDTGGRLGETLRLTAGDVDCDRKVLWFHHTKTGEPRAVPLTVRVQATLRRRLSTASGPQSPVFPSNKDAVERRWARMRKALGLQGDKEFVMHTCRHTCATRMLDQGVDIYTIKTWLGHGSVTTTELYARRSVARLAHARDALDAARVVSQRPSPRVVGGGP